MEIVSPGNKDSQFGLTSIFLTADEYVSVPLEATYQAAFDAVPEVWREILEETR
jgi:hypothetical protein